MGKPRDTKVAILPSTTRKGTTLSTSAALDSPSVIDKLVSPPQAGTSAESENSHNIDNVSAVLDDSGSLGSLLDATIARSRQIENAETPDENATTPVNSPELDYSSDDPDEDYVELNDDFIEKCNATTDARKIKKLLAEHAVRYKLSPDPKFATSPINIKDKDYDFSLDLSHIAIVEKTPFCGTEKESVVEHMIELSTLSSLFSDDVKKRTYFVAKIFPFSLKDDAKTWYNSLPPNSIKSPKELLDVFFRKYFPASAQHIALQRIYNFDQGDGEKLPEAWARFCSLIRARPDHDLEKHDLLDIFYSGLTIESRAYLDSCAGCVFRKRTPDEAEELLAKIGRNHDDWTTPEPTPTPILKKRGLIKLNDEDMREAKKSLKEKGIKSEDVKNLPPIEDICDIIPPSSMIEDPLYPEGHPKRVEQDSQRTKTSAPYKKKKKKKHKNVVESSEPVNDPNSISISDAETESGNEHDNDNDNDKKDASDKEEVEDEPEKHAKNKKYTKEDFIAEKHVPPLALTNADHFDRGKTMPWLGMASSCHHRLWSLLDCTSMSWTSLYLYWISPCPPLTKATPALASTDAPRTPQRRHAVHGRDARARQDITSPRRLSAPLDLSFHLQPHLDMTYQWESYQLGPGGDLRFEKELKQLVDYLGHPYPEFFGIPLKAQLGEPPRWDVSTDLRRKLDAPVWETIWFSVTGNTWKEGLVKAMQEAISRLCGQNEDKIKNTRFIYYPRHDSMGRPMTMPPPPEMNPYEAPQDFRQYKTRRDLDNALASRQAPHP
ncbi:hypothetical protein QYE76_034211 [Lolium multiflorum]|uniref:Retrotransposon gag domain-containing protein n=1 Tax=Lolium multiflorum TaxID=4521 RepID=A0AAD8QWX4_LOLMU|nr:hypothetical protein QYE76_034211 [Lolium multiflorum]